MPDTDTAHAEAAPVEEAPGVSQARIFVDPLGRVDSANTATALQKSTKTLANWRCIGRGPKAFYVDGKPFYWWDEVAAYGRGEKTAA